MHEQQTETSTPETGPEHALETDVAPAIWVGSLADYNAGRLHGSWIDAHQRPEQLYTAIEQVLATSPEAAETGLPSEEWGIFDYEGFGTYRLGEYEDIGRVALLASGIVEWGPAFAAWVDDNREPERIELFQDAYLGHYVSLSAYGDYLTTARPLAAGTVLDASSIVVRSGDLSTRAQTSLTACSGFSTPVPVSQWMKPTWVMLGSSASFASSAAAETAWSSACSMIVVRRPISVASLPRRLQ